MHGPSTGLEQVVGLHKQIRQMRCGQLVQQHGGGDQVIATRVQTCGTGIGLQVADMGDVFLGVQVAGQLQARHGQIGGRHLGLRKLLGKGSGAFAKPTTHIQDAPWCRQRTDLSGEAVVQIKVFVQGCGRAGTAFINKPRQAVAHQPARMLVHIKRRVIGGNGKVGHSGHIDGGQRSLQGRALGVVPGRQAIATGVFHALQMALHPGIKRVEVVALHAFLHGDFRTGGLCAFLFLQLGIHLGGPKLFRAQ